MSSAKNTLWTEGLGVSTLELILIELKFQFLCFGGIEKSDTGDSNFQDSIPHLTLRF